MEGGEEGVFEVEDEGDWAEEELCDWEGVLGDWAERREECRVPTGEEERGVVGCLFEWLFEDGVEVGEARDIIWGGFISCSALPSSSMPFSCS